MCIRDRIQAMRAAPAHPDIYDCGGALPVPNGYPTQFAPPELRMALFPNTLFDPIHLRGEPLRVDRIEERVGKERPPQLGRRELGRVSVRNGQRASAVVDVGVRGRGPHRLDPVSYTHLTLPTSDLV